MAIVLQLHTRLQSFFPLNVVTAERHYRYRGITAFPITVSSSVADNKHYKVSFHWQHGKPSFGEERREKRRNGSGIMGNSAFTKIPSMNADDESKSQNLLAADWSIHTCDTLVADCYNSLHPCTVDTFSKRLV